MLLFWLDSALDEAESDCARWEEHSEKEKGQLESLGRLEEVKTEVKESISDEINELEMIKDQCVKDSKAIGERAQIREIPYCKGNSPSRGIPYHEGNPPYHEGNSL